MDAEDWRSYIHSNLVILMELPYEPYGRLQNEAKIRKPKVVSKIAEFAGCLVKYARFCVSIGFAVFRFFWLSVGVWFGTHP